MFRFASGALLGEVCQIISANLEGSFTAADTSAAFGCDMVCAARCGDGLGCVRVTVAGLLPPKPKNVHQRMIIAATPSTASEITFFFSPCLLKSTSSILVIPDHRSGCS